MLHHRIWLVELCKALINPSFIWQSLMGQCHGNEFKSQNRFFAATLKRIGILERQQAA